MADDFVFDTEKCPSDPVTRVPDDPILADDSVPDAPPDIPDCDLALPPPLPPVAPCPTVEPDSATVTMSPAVSAPRMSITVREGDCCDFRLGGALELPCVGVSATGTISFTDGPSRFAVSVLRPDSASSCDFNLGLSAGIHCVGIEATPAASLEDDAWLLFGPGFRFTDGPGRALVAVTRINECDYTFNFGVESHCPRMNVVAEGGLHAGVVTDEENCNYTLSLGALDCVALSAGSVTVGFSPDSVGHASMTITRSESACGYTLGLDVLVPCVGLSSEPGSASSGGDSLGSPIHFACLGETPKVEMTIRPTGDCGFVLGAQVVVPRDPYNPVLGRIIHRTAGPAGYTETSWDVSQFPSGPSPDGWPEPDDAHTVTVFVAGFTNYSFDAGVIRGPIYPQVGCPGTPTAYYFNPPEVGRLILLTTDVPARDGTGMPGAGSGVLLTFDGLVAPVADTINGGPRAVVVWNDSFVPLLSGNRVQGKMIEGRWFADVDYCPA